MSVCPPLWLSKPLEMRLSSLRKEMASCAYIVYLKCMYGVICKNIGRKGGDLFCFEVNVFVR